MIHEKIINVVADIFEVPIDQINNELSLNSIKQWDSVNHLKLMIALEEEFEIKFTKDDIESMINLSIIESTISSYIDE